MFRKITLEMSLKPFKKTDTAAIESEIRGLFQQWQPLLKERKEISVMLWTADGSEILTYQGKEDRAFEWCCYIGTASNELISDADDPAVSLHARKRRYIPEPPVMTYRILKTIVASIKRIGRELYPDSEITVGETFDIGPEFAVSDFKYRLHPEITSGQQLDNRRFLDATAILHADSESYAAYPEGIPEGTPFSTFFGKQANLFLKDMGFDYLWLSNGVGFGDCPWNLSGKIFDGKRFHTEKLSGIKTKVLGFWRSFRKECPDLLIATRGTNNSAGIDYATDGVALYDIYRENRNILPPPNSPWAAINGDFGLELMGHMTRICELPGKDFLFRYYLHDPWWANSPWYDRYGEEPHDIYLPMAVSRIDENGKPQTASVFQILSVDNSYGERPDACANETIPHIRKAEKDVPDQIGPLVWVYPVREFTTASEEETLSEMYDGDLFIRNALNDGFPLNCVVSSDLFLKHDLALYRNCVLVSPVPQSEEIAARLSEFRKAGGRILFYGSEAAIRKHPETEDAAVSFRDGASRLRERLGELGYRIEFEKKAEEIPSPCITVHSRDRAMLFSVYNPNTTTLTKLRFPLGAPILTGTDCELRNGTACYRFGASEHRECRVFIRQEKGIVSLRELAPVSTVYHRALGIKGLEKATVFLFPEKRKEDGLKVSSLYGGDPTPRYDDRFKRIEDETYGIYYKAEEISGSYTILLPY